MPTTLLSSFPLVPKATPAEPAGLEAETEGRFWRVLEWKPYLESSAAEKRKPQTRDNINDRSK